MHFYLLFTVSAFTAMASAQPHCDPLSQYEKDGICCNMCDPGTRMLPQSTCQDPICEPCGKNEYMDKYTSSLQCELQPYCDPNKNFQVAVHDSKIRSTCLCKEGFHCSSPACITCLEHTTCEPGYGARTQGNQKYDTDCRPCPDGTFSNESSSDSDCVKWTECGIGYKVEKAGTTTSDTTCVEILRGHWIAIIVFVLILTVILLAGLAYYLKKRQSGYLDIREKVYACVGCQETERITQVDRSPLTKPIPVAMQSPLTERSTPVENEDEESILDHRVTENGNVLTQEFGKLEILSRQESQTQDSFSV